MTDFLHQDMIGVLKMMKVICVRIMADSYTEFRVLSYRKGVSVQEILRELVERLVAGDPVLTEIVDELVERKRSGLVKKLSAADADTIYDAIGAVSPVNTTRQ